MKISRNFATVLLGLALCLSVTAAAQDIIDFSGLPQTQVPVRIPDGYGGMNWRGFNYATEFMNSGTRNVAVAGIASRSRPFPQRIRINPLKSLVYRYSAIPASR